MRRDVVQHLALAVHQHCKVKLIIYKPDKTPEQETRRNWEPRVCGNVVQHLALAVDQSRQVQEDLGELQQRRLNLCDLGMPLLDLRHRLLHLWNINAGESECR